MELTHTRDTTMLWCYNCVRLVDVGQPEVTHGPIRPIPEINDTQYAVLEFRCPLCLGRILKSYPLSE